MKRIILHIALWVSLLTAAYPQIRYVKPVATGTGDGSSWANASSDLQAMINAIEFTGGQVWVAQGTYKPIYKISDTTRDGNPTTDRNKAFLLKRNVQVYGGFYGIETSLAQRELLPLGTPGGSILSGDIGIPNNDSDNSYHVVVAITNLGDSACLDGFTITKGNATEAYYFDCAPIDDTTFVSNKEGGGIYIHSDIVDSYSRLVNLKNITVTDNKATDFGGGIYTYVRYNIHAAIGATTLAIWDSIWVSNNTAGAGGGAYIWSEGYTNTYNIDTIDFIIHNMTLTNNTAGGTGGGIFSAFSGPVHTTGIYVDKARARLYNAHIHHNTAVHGGGITSRGNQIFHNCSITHNTATQDGGGVNGGGVNGGAFFNCSIANNTAVRGGGVWNAVCVNTSIFNNTATYGGGTYRFVFCMNCSIFNNTATQDGGGVYNGGGVSVGSILYGSLINCLITDNRAMRGGGIYNRTYSSKFINVTVANNTADIGGGIYSYYPDWYGPYFLTLENAIISDNKANDALDIWTMNDWYAQTNVYYSLIGSTNYGSGKAPNVFSGTISNTNPDFVDLPNGNYRLLPSSLCINTGHNAYYHPDSMPYIPFDTTDLDGNRRINCGTIDMGAYEYHIHKPVLISPNQRICYGDTASIVLDLEGSIPATLIYTQDNGLTSDTVYNIIDSIYQIDVSPWDTAVYKIVKIKNAFCDREPQDSIMVYVIPTPYVNTSSLSDTLCSGEQTQEITFMGNANTYHWEVLGDTVIGLPLGIQIGNFGNYTVENKTDSSLTAIIHVLPQYAEDTIVCTGLADSFSISVLQEPVLQTILENDTLCRGEQTKVVFFQGQATDYQWQNTGFPMKNIPEGIQKGDFGVYTIDSSLTTTLPAIIEVTPLSIMGNKTCMGATSHFSIWTYPQTQILSITKNKASYCENDLLELVVEAKGENLSYQWYHNNSLLAGKTNKEYILAAVSKQDNGDYYVEVRAVCGTKKSNSLSITSSDNMLVEKWEDVILVDNSTNQYIAYQWYKDNNLIFGANNQFYQELGGLNGCYSVELTHTSGQKERSCERCMDKTKKKEFSLYPNPVQQGGNIYIQTEDEIIDIQLYSIDGKHIKTVKNEIGELPTGGLAQGIYVVIIQTKERIYTEKIIVL